MKISLEILARILPDVKFFNLSRDEYFEICNIAHLNSFDTFPPSTKTLYFLVYEDRPEILGWYNKPFDRSQNLETLKKMNNLVFVADYRVSDEQLLNCRYVRVGDIYQAIKIIREYVISSVNPKVVGVTGSVGKTTATSLIESVLSRKFHCGRIYSKRLTPLTLSSWLINFLESNHQILTLEYSMYRKDHIGLLAQMLKPNIAVFLNIERVHLGVDGINTLCDIQEAKSVLIDKSEIGILNADNPLILDLKRKNDLVFSCKDPKADAFIRSDGDVVYLNLNYVNQIIPFNSLYIKTRLFYYQAAATGLVSSLLGIPTSDIYETITNFVPAENRIKWTKAFGEDILFDGDVTISGRLFALANNDYKTSLLLIHSFDFGEENVSLQVDDFNQAFSFFNEVRILDTNENRDIVSKYSFKNIFFFTKSKFLKNISNYQFKVFHFGTYYRKHKDLQYLFNFLSA